MNDPPIYGTRGFINLFEFIALGEFKDLGTEPTVRAEIPPGARNFEGLAAEVPLIIACALFTSIY